VTLVGLTGEQASAMAALHAQAFEAPWGEQAFAALMSGPGVIALAARTDGGLIGLILLRVVADEAEILTLAVAPDHRRRGVARSLLDAGLALARQAGARRAFLEVAVDNRPAIALYGGASFTGIGRRAAYYARKSGPPMDALILSRALEPSDA
jgi:ribosomal-protein-alanine N-acetyltransferase